MKTSRPSVTQVIRDVTQRILDSLPPRWAGRVKTGLDIDEAQADLAVEVDTPTDEQILFAVEASRSLEPRQAKGSANQARLLARRLGAIPVVASSYLSPRTRTILEENEVGYVDTTGNIRLASTSPGLSILMTGAERDPWPRDSGLQSLRGRGSSRAIRAIVDFTPPFGIRELAAESGTSAASLSRVSNLLDRDALIQRDERGSITTVDWDGVIRRWAQDYDQLRSNTPYRYLSPRGLDDIRNRLANAAIQYAATGAFAAQRFDPVAPARTATIYMQNPMEVIEALDLRETDTGANVLLLEPFDSVVFDRTLDRDGFITVAPSQLAADLLTGPGREPSQGEGILVWMKENESAWRT